MNADIAFFLDVGLAPVNKSLYVQGVGHRTVYVRSLLLDPWMFRLPGFAKLFHTHIFAPKDIRRAFLGEGCRLLSKRVVAENLTQFFDERHIPKLEMMDRRKKEKDLTRVEESSRKRKFIDHFSKTHSKQTVTIADIQDNFYEDLPDDFPLERYYCVQEYRFHQFLRFMVGLRYLTLSFSATDIDIDMALALLDAMSAHVKRPSYQNI